MGFVTAREGGEGDGLLYMGFITVRGRGGGGLIDGVCNCEGGGKGMGLYM